MKKKIFLNLVMGTALIATPALLLASCSAQASDIKLPITKKATPDAVSAEELKVSPITLKTVQKLFDNVDVTSFENVTATLKNESVVTGTPNNVVLTAKDGFVFEDGAKTLESGVFTISHSILKITVIDNPVDISKEEITNPITLTTLQKLFNIDADSFKNVTTALKTSAVVVGGNNQVVLTANEGFIFENGTNTLESGVFTISLPKLPITVKDNPVDISKEEITNLISITTLQKLFNIDADSFENVTAALKTSAVLVGETNQMVLTAKEGFIFENGTNTLESGVFTISNSKLKITRKVIIGGIPIGEINAGTFTLTTLQKIFNIDEDSFKNVTAAINANPIVVGSTNQVVLTAKEDFIFTNGARTLESFTFVVNA